MAEQSTGSAAEAQMISIPPSVMIDYAAAIFTAAGADGAVARRLAQSLVLANQSGHDSHGVIRISQYIREIKEGQIDPRAEPTVLREGPAWAVVDGRWGFGHEAARFSMGQAIQKARAAGVGLVSLVRCNHIGRLGEWAEQAAAAGMLGMVSVSLGHKAAQPVAPFGGAGRALSTNPIAFGAPREGQAPILLDFATSVSAEGKIRVARDKGVPVPPGCLIDKHGNPTTNPNDLYEGGALLPFGGHKGYALAVMADVLGLALSGADEPAQHSPTGYISGAFFLAINVGAIRPFDAYAASIERIAERITSVPPAPGFERVLLPGEPEFRTRAERAAAIQLPSATWEAINAAAASLGVTPPAL